MVERDSRKVLRVGLRSLAITIPKKWAQDLGLQAGSTVDMVFDGSKIVIKPRTIGEREETQIFIEISRSLEGALRKLIAGYVEGVTRVKIKASYEEVLELSNKLSDYISTAIIVAKPGSQYHEIIFTDYELSLKDIVDKLASTAMEILNRIEERDKDSLSALYRDFLKSYTLCIREAKGKLVEGYEQPLDVVDVLFFAKYLRELVELLTCDAYDDIQTLDDAVLSTIVELSRASIRSFMENDIDATIRILEKDLRLLDDIAMKISMKFIEKLRCVIGSIAELNLERCVRNRACRCRYFYPKI